MADEPMTVDPSENNDAVNGSQVNGVESKEEQEVSGPDKAVPTEEPVVGSPIKLSVEEEKAEDTKDDTKAEDNVEHSETEKQEELPETPVNNTRGRKRKASESSAEEEELKGFDPPPEPSPLTKYRIDKIEKDIKEAESEALKLRSSSRPPAKRPHLASPAYASDVSSRPSSGLSVRSESDLMGSDLNNSAANSPQPSNKNRKSTVNLNNPLYRVPMEHGWKRELVYRATVDQYQRRQGDIYYYTPQGKKLRSSREVSEHLGRTGLTIDHFTFFKEPLGLDDPEKEIIRDAKLQKTRTESPIMSVQEKSAPSPIIREGKRTPKPKGPKGASPERGVTPKLAAPFKVKSLGSRLSGQSQTPSPTKIIKEPQAKGKKDTPLKQIKKNDKAEDTDKKKAKTPTKVVTPKQQKTPKAALKAENGTPVGRRGKGKVAAEKKDVKPNQAAALKRLMECKLFVHIFGYLNKRELAAAARVCRGWRDIAYTPSLWKTVRMKNSQVTDWQGLAAALKRQKTCHLDLRKMLLPPDDTDSIWNQFTKHIASVESLLRIELCRCPSSVLERICKALPQLQTLTATSLRCSTLNPEPLANMTSLTELRIKGMNGLNLTSDLKCLEKLTKLKHLSLTSVRELEKMKVETIGKLTLLECLELGDCTFSGQQGANLLSSLQCLTRLRLEKSPSEGSATILKAAAKLPHLTHLELINFEIKSGFEEALSSCVNVKRLLIIPMYVSQSATTNKCVLEGVMPLRKTLTHLVWGVTIELLRVTELFIDQCERPADGAARSPKPVKKLPMGDSIPVLKPVPGLTSSSSSEVLSGNNNSNDDAGRGAGPAQVEILPLPTLQRLLNTELPDTRLKILRIPFHATWRQALSDLD